MDQQFIKALLHRHICSLGLLAACVYRDHNVAEQFRVDVGVIPFTHGKRDHIGWALVLQVGLVQLCNMVVVHDEYGYFTVRTVQGV